MADQGVSLNPDHAATGGTLDGVQAVITTAQARGEYPSGIQQPLLAIGFTPDGGKERIELYSLGKSAVGHLKPSADGTMFVPVTPGAKPHKNCNAMKFLMGLVQAGFPVATEPNDPNKLGNRVNVLLGTTVLLRTRAVEKTGNADIDKNNENKTFTYVEKVIALPGENAPAKKPAAAKKPAPAVKVPAAAAPAPAAAPAVSTDADGEDIDALAVQFVTEVLGKAAENTVAKNRIGSEVFQALAKAKVPGPQRTKIMGLVNKADFLTAEGRPWFLDEEKGAYVGMPLEEAA